MKFTKGPWTNDGDDIHAPGIPYIRISAPYGMGTQEICAVAGVLSPQTDEFELTDEVKANAHLIAASPIMFEYIKLKADEGCEDAKSIITKITSFT